MKTTIIWLLILLNFYQVSFSTQNSGLIVGKVVNKKTRQPIPNANVYLAYTMLGSSTNKAGLYEIGKIPSGQYWLIVSHIGFHDKNIKINIKSGEYFRYNFEILPKVHQLKPIIIRANSDRAKNLKTFIKAFIGTSANAKKTYIKNTSFLEFENGDNNVFYATAHGPLIIMNKALGYKIEYSLFHFETDGFYVKYTGFPKYTFLTSTNPDTLSLWYENRKKVYLGSLRHFLHTICKNYELSAGELDDPEFDLNYSDKTEEGHKQKYTDDNLLVMNGFEPLYKSSLGAGFEIKPIITLINTNRYLRPTENPDEFYLKFQNLLEVRYKNVDSNNSGFGKVEKSWIMLEKDSVLIDRRGRYFETFGIKSSGNWGAKRIADTLPYEFSLNDSLIYPQESTKK